MKKIVFILLAIGLLAFSCKTRSTETVTVDLTPQDSLAATKAALTLPEEPVFDIVTTEGTSRVRLFKDTPLHRDNSSKLALAGYYDNLLFHRVINGFMIQGGDPFTRDTSLVARWGEGGGLPAKAAHQPEDRGELRPGLRAGGLGQSAEGHGGEGL